MIGMARENNTSTISTYKQGVPHRTNTRRLFQLMCSSTVVQSANHGQPARVGSMYRTGLCGALGSIPCSSLKAASNRGLRSTSQWPISTMSQALSTNRWLPTRAMKCSLLQAPSIKDSLDVAYKQVRKTPPGARTTCPGTPEPTASDQVLKSGVQNHNE